MTLLHKSILILASLGFLAGCSSSDDSPATNPITESLSTVNTKLSTMSNLMGGTSTSASAINNSSVNYGQRVAFCNS